MNNDKDLFRQALQRQNERAARMKMPDDMEQRVMHRIRSKKVNRRWLYTIIATVAASILLILVFRFSQEPVEEQPLVAETIEKSIPQPVLQPIVEEKKEKKEELLAEVQLKKQPSKKHRKAERMEPEAIPQPVEKSTRPVEKPVKIRRVSVQTEDVLIPADKQALADMYLAEVALQVIYQQREQNEAVRSYAASITGEEVPQPIIAF